MSGFASKLWQRVFRRVGASGIIGLAMLLLAGALSAWAPRLQHQAARLYEAAQVRRSGLAASARVPAQGPTTRQQLQRFAASFPPPRQEARDLEWVFAAAQRHKIDLPKGDYQVSVEPNSPFVVASATFPVKASYGDVKAFTADVLRGLPHAAIDELRLERSEATNTMLDARIRFTLTYRSP